MIQFSCIFWPKAFDGARRLCAKFEAYFMPTKTPLIVNAIFLEKLQRSKSSDR
jgi:hypothetical protein